MKTWAWAVPALLGLGLMFVSFDRLLKLDPEAPWSHGFLFIGHGEAGKPLDVGGASRHGCGTCPQVARTRPCSQG